jgi:hypothetical protein
MQEQLEESQRPKPKRVVKNPGSRPRQRRPRIENDDDDDYEVELETTRSGKPCIHSNKTWTQRSSKLECFAKKKKKIFVQNALLCLLCSKFYRAMTL